MSNQSGSDKGKNACGVTNFEAGKALEIALSFEQRQRAMALDFPEDMDEVAFELIHLRDLNAELLRRLASVSQPEPRCPKCGSDKLSMPSMSVRVHCKSCRELFYPKSVAEFSQFFAPRVGERGSR